MFSPRDESVWRPSSMEVGHRFAPASTGWASMIRLSFHADESSNQHLQGPRDGPQQSSHDRTIAAEGRRLLKGFLGRCASVPCENQGNDIPSAAGSKSG